MSETEKITINLSVVDLGKIDLLVEEGFYSNRTDMIRTAIRNQLERHATTVEQAIGQKDYAVGIMVYTQGGLEEAYEKGEMLDVRVVGMFAIGSQVTPELALATLSSVKVNGVFQASREVKAALAEAGRIR